MRTFRAVTTIAACWLALIADAAPKRTIVFISDVHLGLGVDDPKEDFRTPETMPRFLDAVTAKYGDAVDLVILGDLFELWQPPKGIDCGNVPEVGCTVADMRKIARHVVKAHARELASLGAFASRGDNRVHVVPGNHDAALLDASVWKEVFPSFAATAERVQFVESGVWLSSDGKVAGEHGHQIAPDANRYDTWTTVTKKGRMIRPWGEWFVQRLYNAEEETYPLIDNVTGSAGAKIRAAERGWPGTARDLAKLIGFVLFENSFRQKEALLSRDTDPDVPPPLDLALARKKKGELMVLALPAPERALVTADARRELDALVASMPDAEIESLCAAIDASPHPCVEHSLGQGLRATVIPKSSVMRAHLHGRMKTRKSLTTFVYGHTHVLEEPWEVEVGYTSVEVANTGAFHPTTDEATFRAAAAKHDMTAVQALRKLPFAALPPCHTVVVVTQRDGLYVADVRQWNGEKIEDACTGVCARVSGCPKPKPAAPPK